MTILIDMGCRWLAGPRGYLWFSHCGEHLLAPGIAKEFNTLHRYVSPNPEAGELLTGSRI